MNGAAGQILIIRGGAIGDFILTLPVLAALRNQFPTARLEVLGYDHIAPLATLGGLADAVRSIESGTLAGYFARQGNLAPELEEYFAGFAIIISYLYDPDLIFQTNVARSSKAQFIAGPHRPDESEPVPASVAFLKPLERLAIFDPDPIPRLRLPPRPDAAPTPFTVAAHPGSGSERKNWPQAKWAELIRLLIQETNWQLLLVGGEAEGNRLQSLRATSPPDRVKLLQNLPLTHLAQQLTGAQAFIGHDSGISHLAAAAGLPGVILWGDSVEAIWRPPSQKAQVLRSVRGIEAIPVREAFESLLKLEEGENRK